jgi:hypothetical protein
MTMMSSGMATRWTRRGDIDVDVYFGVRPMAGEDFAQQLRLVPIVQLLQLSLAEEEIADQLLNQLSRPLMSSARMPELFVPAE